MKIHIPTYICTSFKNIFYALKKIKSIEVNEYLGEYTCKDFRTYGANKEFHKYLCALDNTNIKKNIAEAIKYVSELLGNTVLICRKSYISPVLISKYEKSPDLFVKKSLYNLL